MSSPGYVPPPLPEQQPRDINKSIPIIPTDALQDSTVEAGVAEYYGQKYRIPWPKVRLAVEHGYIYPGWSMMDYIHATYHGIPHEIATKKIKRLLWNNQLMWGPQGCLTRDTKILRFTGSDVRAVKIGSIPEGIPFTLPSYDISHKRLRIDVGIVINTGHKPVFELNTLDGTIYATREHPFLTERGWRRTDRLERGDEFVNGKKAGAVVSVRPCGDEMTYNLHVAHNNNFLLEQGIITHNSGKSSFALQCLFGVYHDWDSVLNRNVVAKEKLIQVYKEAKGLTIRIPALNIDDLTTIVPKQLWFVDKDFHILFQQFLAVVRPKIGTLLTTLPNIKFTWESLGEVLTTEVLVYPNQTYMVERMCWDVDPYHPLEAAFDKIVVEYANFNLEAIPHDVWMKYQEERQVMADSVYEMLVAHLEGRGTKDRMRKRVIAEVKKTIKNVRIWQVINATRKKGIKFSNDGAAVIIKTYREMLMSYLSEGELNGIEQDVGEMKDDMGPEDQKGDTPQT